MNDPSFDRKTNSLVDHLLGFVERVGNSLPHPATLFATLAALVLILSWVFSWLGVTVIHPASGEEIRAENLISVTGLHRILTETIQNFTGFAPLGTVLVAMLGISVAEGSGLIGVALRLLVLSAPKQLLTFVIVMAGILSNTASEIGYVLLVPLGAVIFLAVGRHPVAGLAAAFAGVSGGYSANLLLGTVDPLLSGLSEEAAQIVDPTYAVNPACNYYFMAVSTVFISLAGTWVTERLVIPRLGPYRGDAPAEELRALTPEEKRGLRWAAAATFLLVGIALLGLMPEDVFTSGSGPRLLNTLFSWVPTGFLLEPETASMLRSPFMRGIVVVIFIFGALVGIAYGLGAGTIHSDSDVVRSMGKAMETLGTYMVLVFFAAQFVAYFNWTNLGLILAIRGAELLRASGLGPIPLLSAFVLLTALINLFMGSSSAKWAIMAPIFVPMFMFLGYSPEMVQAAYRVGDSTTNIISPMMSYFALIVAFMERYEPRAGIGSVVATMLPYSVVFLVVWLALLMAWIWLGIPVGPGAPLFLS